MTPSMVPKGRMRHSMPAMTMQNTCFLLSLSLLPAAMTKPARVHPRVTPRAPGTARASPSIFVRPSPSAPYRPRPVTRKLPATVRASPAQKTGGCLSPRKAAAMSEATAGLSMKIMEAARAPILFTARMKVR